MTFGAFPAAEPFPLVTSTKKFEPAAIRPLQRRNSTLGTPTSRTANLASGAARKVLSPATSLAKDHDHVFTHYAPTP